MSSPPSRASSPTSRLPTRRAFRDCPAPTRSPSPICRMCGSSATCTRTISTPCTSASTADIHLNAYPNKVLKARIDNILPTLDPTIRTAKVRLEVANPGMLRIGMFTTATFYGKQAETRAAVPATAILHIHDRDWVFVPAGNGAFKRLEVTAGGMLPGKHAGDCLGHQSRSTGGSERAGDAEHGGAIDDPANR